MTVRHRHYIKPNLRTELPSQAIWVDTETTPHKRKDGSIEHRLKFGWSCYQRYRGDGHWCEPVWRRFTSARELWGWVVDQMRPRTRCYFFCHNTNFDLPVLKAFSLPLAFGGELIRAVIDAPPTIVHWKFETATLVILDTLNFWRVPLKDLGESIGVKKLSMPLADASRAEWDTYCKQDVEVIRLAMLRWWRFLEEHDLGGFAPTLAGQALRSWRHRFMDTPVLIDDDEEALALARESYLGGRNEVFRHGRIEGPIYYLDYNSMYPKVMADGMFPTILVGVDKLCPERTFMRMHKTHATIGKVLLRVNEGTYPRVIDKRLCFPVGTFWAVLAGPELEHAYTHGHILKWESLVVYKQANLFNSFVKYIYPLRLKAKAAGDSVSAYFLKILLNSLYGKYGQRGMVWSERGKAKDNTSATWLEYNAQTGQLIRHRQLAGLHQSKAVEGESRESHPAIASYVTSYGRLLLLQAIEIAGREHVFYCDTDGFFTNATGHKRLAKYLHKSRLGALKVESINPDVTVRGLKDYTLGGTNRVKGVKKTARWLTYNEIQQEQWSGLTGQLGRGDLDNAVTKTITKHLTRQYTKGVFMPDGSVKPLQMHEC